MALLPRPSPIRPVWLAALLLVATALSVVRTGFHFGISNNVFHVPLVLDWAQQPAFEQDAFYATLGKFTSVVWPIVRWVVNEANVGLVFFVGHFVSRLLAVLAILWLLIRHFQMQFHLAAVGLLVCVLTPWLVGASSVGGHGLWVRYFTHSEVTWGPLLAALMAAQAGRWVLAGALAGVVFAINAFVGIWLLAILGPVFLLGGGERAWSQVPKGALAFGLLASPVLVWIVQSMSTGARVDFDYLEYIRTYYPEHFLIEAATPRELVIFAFHFLLGLLAAALSPRPRFWLVVLGACAMVFAAGAVLPYMLNQRIVFNLHLLRIEGVAQWLSVVLAIAVLSVRLGGERDPSVRVFAMIGLLSMLSTLQEPTGLAFAALSLLAIVAIERGSRWIPGWLRAAQCRLAVAFTAMVIAAGAWRWDWTLLNGLLWIVMGGWALGLLFGLTWRRPYGVFVPVALIALLPHIAKSPGLQLEDAHPPGLTELTTWVREQGVAGPFLISLAGHGDGHDYFQLLSRQRVWVDWKQGAAVMWEPRFRDQWIQRYREVKALKTPAEFADYARVNGLRHMIVDQVGADCPTATRQLFRTSQYLLCQLD